MGGPYLAQGDNGKGSWNGKCNREPGGSSVWWGANGSSDWWGANGGSDGWWGSTGGGDWWRGAGPASRWDATNSGNTPLHRAAREGDAEEVRRLVQQAGNSEEERRPVLRAANKYGATALHSAASAGHEECCRALLHLASPEERRRLLGAESGRGNTPHALAVVGGHERCAAALLGLAEDAADVKCSAADQSQEVPCRPLRQPEGDQPLVVYVQNLLARGFTNHNKKQHGATGEESSLESPGQTRARYEMSTRQLLSRDPSPDVALFQECENAYFDPCWNSLAAELQDQYQVYHCCWGTNLRTKGPNPGSAVLVKKGGSAVPSAAEATCIGGADTGRSSKVAAVLPLKFQGKDLLAVSAHITFVPPRAPPTELLKAQQQRARHIELISAAVAGHPAIIGGDFNCEPGRELDEVLKPLRTSSSAFAVVSPHGCSTGLDGQMRKAVQIDYVLASKELRSSFSEVLGPPQPPWQQVRGEAGVVCASSDHVPVCAELLWR